MNILTLIRAYGLEKWKGIESIGFCPMKFADIHDTCALLHRDTLTILNVHEGNENNVTSSFYMIKYTSAPAQEITFGNEQTQFHSVYRMCY